jgi:hypothetical protein
LRGGYFYVVEGGPVLIDCKKVPALGAAKIVKQPAIRIEAIADAELLMVDVGYT